MAALGRRSVVETKACGRVSDDELLRTVWRDLGAVYTDILREPIPDRLAAVLDRLESTFQPRPSGRSRSLVAQP